MRWPCLVEQALSESASQQLGVRMSVCMLSAQSDTHHERRLARTLRDGEKGAEKEVVVVVLAEKDDCDASEADQGWPGATYAGIMVDGRMYAVYAEC